MKKKIFMILGSVLAVLTIGIIIPKFSIKNPDLSSSLCAAQAAKENFKLPVSLFETAKVTRFSKTNVDMDLYTIFNIKYGQGFVICDPAADNDNGGSSSSTSSPVSSLFVNLPQQLRVLDKSLNLSADKGFVITTAVKSHSGDKAAYAEISDCIDKLNFPNQYDPSACNWTYKIYVKSLLSGITNQIYSYPSDPSPYFISLVPTAYAGGCPLVPFPIAWSNKDVKVILQWGNPTACGSGGTPKFSTFTINANGGKLEGLATGGSLFVGNYEQVIFTDYSEKSPMLCGPSGYSNSGRIVQKGIESGKVEILKEEPNTYYEIKKLENGELEYVSRENKLIKQDSCGEVNYSLPGQEGKITIVNFVPSQGVNLKQSVWQGSYICLPHRDTTGPQTEECALGLKGDDGNYYSLDVQGKMDMYFGIGTGSRIKVAGSFVPIEAISSLLGQKYPVVGIIRVDTLEKLK